jgi:DNA modification methylase
LDIFCGSGQGLGVALSNGRNAIGYDIDPLSIEFCEKRLQKILNNPDTEIGVAA